MFKRSGAYDCSNLTVEDPTKYRWGFRIIGSRSTKTTLRGYGLDSRVIEVTDYDGVSDYYCRLDPDNNLLESRPIEFQNMFIWTANANHGISVNVAEAEEPGLTCQDHDGVMAYGNAWYKSAPLLVPDFKEGGSLSFLIGIDTGKSIRYRIYIQGGSGNEAESAVYGQGVGKEQPGVDDLAFSILGKNVDVAVMNIALNSKVVQGDTRAYPKYFDDPLFRPDVVIPTHYDNFFYAPGETPSFFTTKYPEYMFFSDPCEFERRLFADGKYTSPDAPTNLKDPVKVLFYAGFDRQFEPNDPLGVPKNAPDADGGSPDGSQSDGGIPDVGHCSRDARIGNGQRNTDDANQPFTGSFASYAKALAKVFCGEKLCPFIHKF